MSDAKHSPEPWAAHASTDDRSSPCYVIHTLAPGCSYEYGDIVAQCCDWRRQGRHKKENAERIVACVNALAGLTLTPGLLKQIRFGAYIDTNFPIQHEPTAEGCAALIEAAYGRKCTVEFSND